MALFDTRKYPERNTMTVASTTQWSGMCMALRILLWSAITPFAAANSKVPIVGRHNNQIRLQLGDRLRLECPVHSTSSREEESTVMYHWRVQNRLDYTLDSDPRYRFSQDRRILEVTVPLSLADAGTYTCSGVTGFGKREVTFEVHIRGRNADLLCAPHSHSHPDVKVPCFLDPSLKRNPVITVERPVGSTVKLNCEADGMDPIRYRWLMGNTVADWIATGQGTRGPILTIDRVGREHTGHYTCQVSNPGGNLNYTYRLIVTEPPSATPRIVTASENHTFTTDVSASLAAQIQCTCDEPVIQWLKRIEPGEEHLYDQHGVTRISLPNAREAERNEQFLVLGGWTGSPATVEQTVTRDVENQENAILSSDGSLITEDTASFHLKKSGFKESQGHLFLTRIHLQKPLEKEKHAGKYIVMTMSLSDIKSIEYAVMYVDIVQDPMFIRGRRILVYFLVPFCLLFVTVGMLSYVLVCRRRGSSRRSLASSNDRSILRTKESNQQAYQVMLNGRKTSTSLISSRRSSNSQVNGRHLYNVASVQPPRQSTEPRLKSAPNGLERQSREPSTQSNRMVMNVSQLKASNSLTNGVILTPTSPYNETSTNCLLQNTNGSYIMPSQTAQRSPPYPNVSTTKLNQLSCDSQVALTHPAYYAAAPGSATSACDVSNVNPNIYQGVYPFSSHTSNPMVNVSLSQTNMTEISFDQYSAVSQSPLSSSTLTNHYTAPFGENTRGYLNGGITDPSAYPT